MQITRSSEIPSQQMLDTRLYFLAGPANGATEITLLRGTVPAGGTFAAHSHDHEEVLYFISAAASFTIGDQTGSVSAGDVVVIPAGVVHAFDATEAIDAVAALPAGTKTFAPDGTELGR